MELADVGPDDVAQRLGMSPATLRRTLAGKRAFTTEEVQALTELLGVPEWFLREGVQASTPAPAERGELEEKVTWLTEAVYWCVLTLEQVSAAVEAAEVDGAAVPERRAWPERAAARGR